MADDREKPCDRGDELQVGPAIGDGARLFVRHKPGCERVMGVMRPVAEGESLTGNVFTVKPKDPAHGVYHVEDIPIPKPAGMASGKSHSGAASDAFRNGWENTFGGRSGYGPS